MWADWGAMSAREWRSTETFGQPVQRFWNERSSFLGKLQQDRQRWKSRKRKDARALRQKAPAGTRRAKGGAVHFMKSSRGTLIFMLLAVIGVDHAAAASPAFDARKTRLAEIAVHCFVPRTDGVILERRYRLDAFGGLTFVRDTNASAAVTIPAEEFDKVLLSGAAWGGLSTAWATGACEFRTDEEHAAADAGVSIQRRRRTRRAGVSAVAGKEVESPPSW